MDFFLITFLFFLSALFSGSEVAIFSLSETVEKKLTEKNSFFARNLNTLLQDKNNCLIVILVGNLIVNTFLSAMISKIVMDLFGEEGLAWAVFLISILLIFFGEVSPKSVALKISESFAMIVSPLLVFCKNLLFPLIFLLQKVNYFLLSLLPGIGREENLSTDELSTLVSLGEQQGVFNGWEKKLIEQVLEFHDVYAVERMVPRPDVICVELHEQREEILKKVKGIPFSKIPVYEEDQDFIVGYFQVKDFLLFENKKISQIIKPVYVIPEMKPLDRLLQEMQAKNIKMAVILDEYANVQGIITIEAILDTVFGELNQNRAKKPEIQKLDGGTILIHGGVGLRQVNDFLDEELFDEEDPENRITVAGFVMRELNQLPVHGDVVQLKDYQLRVSKILKRRIMEVELRKEES